MRKHLWAIIVPRLFSSSSGAANSEVVEPGHWRKMTVSQDQAEIWRELWGKDISMSQSSRWTDPTTGKAGPCCPPSWNKAFKGEL